MISQAKEYFYYRAKLANLNENEQNFLFYLYSSIIETMNKKFTEEEIRFNINLVELFNLLYEENKYNIENMDSGAVNNIYANTEYINKIAKIVTIKFLSCYSCAEKNKEDLDTPSISTMKTYLVRTKQVVSAVSLKNPMLSLIPDILLNSLNVASGIVTMLENNLNTDAFSSWRTLHEAECTAIILTREGKELQNTYLKFITYNNAFKGAILDKEENDKIFEQLKAEMKQQGLQSKDMKKFIEFGWLYSIPNLKERYKDFRLNFKFGAQLVAELDGYQEWYEMASEIVHSSPILFYANSLYFRQVSIVSLYHSVSRIDDLVVGMIKSMPEELQKHFQSYLEFRSSIVDYLREVKTIEERKLEELTNEK